MMRGEIKTLKSSLELDKGIKPYSVHSQKNVIKCRVAFLCDDATSIYLPLKENC